jgi:hypothetical protein
VKDGGNACKDNHPGGEPGDRGYSAEDLAAAAAMGGAVGVLAAEALQQERDDRSLDTHSDCTGHDSEDGDHTDPDPEVDDTEG